MAFAGFGKSSGPSIPPKAPTPLGTSSSSSPPPNPKPSSDSKITFPAIQPPIQQQQTPPSAKRRVMPLDWEYQPKQSSNISYNLSPQKLSFVAASVTARNVDANISVRPDNPRTISSFDIRPAMPHSWHNQPMPPTNLSYVTHPQRLSPVAVSGIAHDVGATISIKPDVLKFAKRNRSPPLTSREDEILELYSPPNANARRPVTLHSWHNQLKQPTSLPYRTSSQRMSPIRSSGIARDPGVYISTQNDNLNAFRSTRSPPLPSHEDDILGLYNPPNANARGLATSPSLSSHLKEPVNIPSMNNQRLSPIATNGYPHDAAANFRAKPINLHVAKRNRSPPLLSHDDDILDMYNHNGNGRRIDDPLKWTRSSSDVNSQSVHSLEVSVETAHSHDASGPRTGTQRSPIITAASHQMNPVITSAEALSPIPPASLGAPKRSRSPPLQSADVSSTSYSIQLDSEREIQAKAKRLARFNIELSKPLQTPNDLSRHKFSGNKQDQVLSDKQRNAKGHDDEAWEGTGTAVLSDYEGMESSKVVVGKCTDMCPESEREERERKGDLDKFERLNGERNQTTKFLAVKKYNRTAEREADLIRPLPVLRETVDYLLNLLDQPYNENFLGIYNFLWDRMRAVRMDLRMQHIFNQEAILMLEQMIRLHIVAMHELCEYRKGESFVEGFDAHLNIEQMNKTSVELFQMYDDHRKRGKSFPTEKEFRGYYALLKLDKHPGYKVEPSELSLDLAKMTPEMRCAPEILFARAVARACRFGNFIAFFRLARKATYLQACLMHAHFAKLRTQALASLHSGLQNNQGIPVSHVVKWLGMEGEDIESLLEYHGFSLRRYEELYMVKEGLFLNIDADYLTTRSQLVHLKKSISIADDVKSGPAISQPTEERKNESALRMADLRTKPFMTVDEEMLEFKVDSVPRVVFQPRHLFEEPLPTIWNKNYDHELPDASLSIWNMDKDREMIEAYPIETTCLSEDDSFSDKEQHVGIVKDISVNLPAWSAPEGMVQAGVPASSDLDFIVANPAPQRDAEENQENEVSIVVHHRKNEETIKEKLKIILRKWKERASKLRETREQREFLANAALSSLPLGPPVRRQNGVSYAAEVLNIDYVARERCGKLEKSWATLNISELTQPIHCTRNPDAKCISWKLLFLVQGNGTENHAYNLAMKWLHSKIMGSGVETNGELLVSLPNLSIWKNRTSPKANEMEVCCLAIVRQTRLGEDDLIDGSSSLLFLASGSISWDIQRVQLHKLLASIPSGVNLPLLILTTDTYEESVSIINKLGLHAVDKTKISSLSVVFLCGNSYFDDDQLKEGLKWLASNSPLQPILHSVSTRELALRYLKRSSSVLENTKASDVNPNHCIAAFNEALDHSCEEIIAAASINPNQWPSPEINLLDKSSDMCLPSIGWSSPERIEPIIMAIKGCRLPPFPSDMSFLNEGSTMIRELQNKKLAIEECLINYLTKSTQLLNLYLAEKEANVMLQKGADLELRGSCHYIVPRWSVIFQRIYNWRLMRLRGDKCLRAYIVVRKDETDVSNNSDVISPSEFSQTEISLDELMEISCIVQIAKEPESVFKRQYSPPVIISNEDEEGKKFACSVSATVVGERNEERVSPVSSKKDNRLDMLLEQCNQLQDMIQTKLSIYF